MAETKTPAAKTAAKETKTPAARKAFVFVGSGEDDPKEVCLYGVEFELNGEAQEVPADKVAKFEGNSHFEKA